MTVCCLQIGGLELEQWQTAMIELGPVSLVSSLFFRCVLHAYNALLRSKLRKVRPLLWCPRLQATGALGVLIIANKLIKNTQKLRSSQARSQ